VAPVTIAVGIVLILLGVIGYVPTQAPTALIPAGFGVALLLLGVLARQDKVRKHAMHTAVLVGLVGFVGAAVMVVRALAGGGIELPLAFAMQALMAVVCGVFVGLCVKSFIDARRKQRQEASG
jgi:zinc transporter ZupT